MKQFDVSNSSRAALAILVRDRYWNDKQYRNSTALMSGMTVDKWIEAVDLMMLKVHENEELTEIPEMKRYFGLGQTRVDATVSWRQDLLLNTADAPFTMQATPVPTMAPKVIDEVTEQILTELWLRVGQLPPSEMVENGRPNKALQKFIAKRAPDMKETQALYLNRRAKKDSDYAEILVKDAMAEGHWRRAFWAFQRSHTKYPCAVMCGPELVPVSARKYTRNGGISRVNSTAMQWREVDLKNFFFGSDSTRAENGRGCTELRYKNRSRLIQAMNNPDYDHVAIRKVLDEFESIGRNWLDADYTGTSVQNYWSNMEGEEIPVLIHHGQISGRELLDGGITGVDRYKMYEVRCEVVSSHVIYCQLGDQQDDGQGLEDSHARPYFSSSWKVDDHTPYGRSLGMMLREPQLILNRLHYMTMANAYSSHLPMTELIPSRLESPMDWYFQPGAAFDTRADAKIVGESSALRMHQTAPTFQALFNLFVTRMKLVDDEIGITAVSYGSMVMTPDDKTLGGQLQRISGSARGLKDAVYNQDIQLIEPSMQRSVRILQDTRKIQGDINVRARGAASLIQKDAQSTEQQKILPLVIQAAQVDPRYTEAKNSLLDSLFLSAGVPPETLPDATLDKEYRALSGLPATPQQQADGRSLNADQLGANL